MYWTPPNTPARSATPAATFAFVRHGRGVAYFNRPSAIVNQQWLGAAECSGVSVDEERGLCGLVIDRVQLTGGGEDGL
jgi:hypothetical protein